MPSTSLGRFALSLVVCYGVAAPMQAMQWDTGGGLDLSTIYTDNFCLTPDDEVDKWIGTATPRLNLNGTSPRSTVNLLASLQFNTVGDIRDDCPQGGLGGIGNTNLSPAPRLRFNNSNELVPQFLFLDLGAFADQNRVNAFGRGGIDNLDGTGNINTTYAYNISPYINTRLGSSSNLFLRYRYNDQRNSEDIVRDSTSQRVDLDLGMSPDLNTFSVGLSGYWTEVVFDENRRQPRRESELANLRVRGAWNISRVWQLNGFVGQDFNDFLTFAEDEDIDGSVWDIGLTWRPNTRVTVAAGTGEAFFGSTPRLSISYRHKRSSISLNYIRQLTYPRDLRGADIFPPDIDPDFTDEPGLAGTPTTLTTQPVLNESVTFIYQFQMRRTSLGFTGFYSEQTRGIDLSEATFQRYALNLGWRPSQRLSFRGRVGWAQREGGSLLDEGDVGNPGVFARDSETWTASLTADREFTNHLSMLLRYQWRDRASNENIDIDGFTENRITLTLRYTL
jgi:uncharacterized protein (PEP-CTERM system associated)